jgi:hypothetical protein
MNGAFYPMYDWAHGLEDSIERCYAFIMLIRI